MSTLDYFERWARAQLGAIGEGIGYGRAQQILGELWDARHDCAPRGSMGVTVDDALPPVPPAGAYRRQQRADGGYNMVPAYTVAELKAYGHAAIAKSEPPRPHPEEPPSGGMKERT